MTVRSVTVRYAADVSSLIAGLDRAAAANARAAGQTEATGRKIDGLAKAGVGLALATGVAIARFAEFDAQMSQVAAATGATGQELASLREAALQAGRDTKYSATEAADGITQLSKAGVSSADIIGGGLTGALDLAAAGNIAVGDAAETAATALTQFKLQGKDIPHLADLLAAGANKAQGGVGDLAMALKQGGLVAAQTGLTIEETTAGLTAFASAGLIGSDAGTSFKTMLQRLTPQSEVAREKMNELGISAYDSQGNFIGLANFAGVLQGALKDLTPEQRNAALATIFGSDAVRAASVLYDQGAEGIQKWTKEVNESGYAARQAAILSDNLQGDLKRLGSMFDSVLIQTGSGANDTLRLIVSTLTGALDLFSKIPGPILLGVAALTTFSLVGRKVGSLATQAFAPLTNSMGRFRQELALQRALAGGAVTGLGNLGIAATAASRSIGGLRGAASSLTGMLGGPWGIALTIAVAALAGFAQANANAQQAADSLRGTLDQVTGALQDASKQNIADAIAVDVSPDDLARLKEFGVDLQEAVNVAGTGGAAMEAYQEKLRALAAAHPEVSAAAYGLSSSIENQNEVVQRAQADLQARKDLLGDQAGASDTAATSTDGLTGSIDDLTLSTGEASGPNVAFTDLLTRLGEASDSTKQNIDALRNAVDLLSGGELALRAASRDMEAAIEDAGEAAKQKASKTKSAAQVEREFQASLDKVATSTQEVIKQMISNGATSDQLKSAYDRGRAAIEKQLTARGLHGAALQREADKIMGTRADMELLISTYKSTPATVTTNVVLNSATASGRIAAYKAELAAIPRNKTTTLTIRRIQNDIRLEQNGINTNLFRGGIVKAYAAGGIGDVANAHRAEIVPAGSWRVFGEPETQGEAYIPFANDWRRPRAKAIADETVRRLGGQITWNAGGGIYGGASGFDKAGMAHAIAASIPLGMVIDALRALPASVEAGAARGMIARSGADRRNNRAGG